jgi:putative flippase GtrA
VDFGTAPQIAARRGRAVIKDWQRKFIYFVVFGAITTGIQYVILILAVESWRADPVFSSCVGYFLSAIISYLLNYRFTFKSDHSHVGASIRFAIVSGTGLLLNGLIMHILVHSLQTAYIVAQVIATATVLLWNFLGSALWAFGGGRRSAAQS